MPADFLHCLFRWVSAAPVPRSSHVRVFVHISCCGSNKEAHVTQQLRGWCSSPLRLYCWETFSHLSIWTGFFRNVNHSRDSHFAASFGGWPSLRDLVKSQWDCWFQLGTFERWSRRSWLNLAWRCRRSIKVIWLKVQSGAATLTLTLNKQNEIKISFSKNNFHAFRAGESKSYKKCHNLKTKLLIKFNLKKSIKCDRWSD